MSVKEIEVALSGLNAEELARVEATLRGIRARRNSSGANGEGAKSQLTHGFDVFPKRNEQPVTIELVRQICAEEGFA